MNRKTKAGPELTLRTLGDDELAQVSGAYLGYRPRRRRTLSAGSGGGDVGGEAEPLTSPGGTSSTSPTAPVQQITIIQVVTGNTAPVALLNIFGF